MARAYPPHGEESSALSGGIARSRWQGRSTGARVERGYPVRDGREHEREAEDAAVAPSAHRASAYANSGANGNAETQQGRAVGSENMACEQMVSVSFLLYTTREPLTSTRAARLTRCWRSRVLSP